MNSYFITATGTDVGKTVVTAGILRYLRKRDVNAVSMKPIQTGAEYRNGKLSSPDLMVHLAASGYIPPDDQIETMSPYLYEPACSPHLAGRMSDRYPDPAKIRENFVTLAKNSDMVLVEGAGGILAPITESATMLDLMIGLNLPVILVAHRGLGTINHTLLSIDTLRRANLDIAGVVLNETEDVEPDFIKKDNPAAIEHFGKTTVLGNINYLTTLSENPDQAWKEFETCMPGLTRLLDTP
jgi:dethiobiotin synthase